MSHVPDTLRIELPELPCRIGILEGENETPQPVRVAVTVETDLARVLESANSLMRSTTPRSTAGWCG